MSPPQAQTTPEPALRPAEAIVTMDEGELPASPLGGPVDVREAAVGGAASIPKAADPLVGTVVDGRYQVIAKIAEGGMGRVYRAHHRTANRTVALKVLMGDCDPAHREVREARFIREARVISGLAHPNVVQVYDFGVLPNGELFYVMEFIAGEPLADLVFDCAPLPVERITHLALQMAAGLHAAHEQGIVHRDLKPENVIVIEHAGEELAKVVDFGIAKILGETGKKLTRTGIVTGTPHYISPEQARAADLDQRSDVYSFGVMLYEMAVGKLPFDVDDGSWVALLEAHIRQPPPPPSERGVDIGPLEPIILRCLAKDPAHRFQSMAELVAALQDPNAAARVSPAPPAVSSAPPPALPVRGLRSVAAVGLLALALGGGTWWAVSQLQSAPAPVQAAPSAPTPVQAAAPPPRPVAQPAAERAAAAPARPTTHLVSEPPGAEVTVDGVVIGNTPIEVPLPEEGTQPLRLTLPDHLPVERELTIDARSEWALTLPPRPAPRRASPSPAPVATEAAPAEPVSVTDSPRIRIEEPINPWAD